MGVNRKWLTCQLGGFPALSAVSAKLPIGAGDGMGVSLAWAAVGGMECVFVGGRAVVAASVAVRSTTEGNVPPPVVSGADEVTSTTGAGDGSELT